MTRSPKECRAYRDARRTSAPAQRAPAVVIVAYENHDLLEQCLASVTEHLPGLPIYIYASGGDGYPGVRNWPPGTPRCTGFWGR